MELKLSQRSVVAVGAARSLLPKVGHPFFIVAPAYTRASAGITVLHLLCHYLNLLGESAFIVRYPPQWSHIRGLPDYCTLVEQTEFPGGMLAPILTQNVLDFYDEQRLNPIVIYPEVYDNPLKSGFFGRYILNFPGKIAPGYVEPENFSVAYTKILADDCTQMHRGHPPTKDTLFVPTCDLDFWNTHGAAQRRSGTCFYCAKMRDVYGESPKGVPEGSVEILRALNMSRKEIRELFWRSEAFYCYEDTALAIEANLCGCPTVHVPNSHYTGVNLAHNELGEDGFCLAGDPEGFERAKLTAGKLERTMRAHMASVPLRIAELAARWKAMAAEQDYRGMISYPLKPQLVFFQKQEPAEVRVTETESVIPAAGPTHTMLTRQALGALLLAIKRSIAFRFPLARKLLRPIYRLARGKS